MSAPVQVAVRNRLLASLAPEDFSLLQPLLEPVALPGRLRLVTPNTPINHAYFLEQGIASVMATTSEPGFPRWIGFRLTFWPCLSKKFRGLYSKKRVHFAFTRCTHRD